jgi:hypothetical protein
VLIFNMRAASLESSSCSQVLLFAVIFVPFQPF